MKNLIDVYVVWAFDGPIMTSLLQYEDSDDQRMAMQQWSPQDYVEQAFDVEFGAEGGNEISEGASYELAAIFISNDIHWIY